MARTWPIPKDSGFQTVDRILSSKTRQSVDLSKAPRSGGGASPTIQELMSRSLDSKRPSNPVAAQLNIASLKKRKVTKLITSIGKVMQSSQLQLDTKEQDTSSAWKALTSKQQEELLSKHLTTVASQASKVVVDVKSDNYLMAKEIARILTLSLGSFQMVPLSEKSPLITQPLSLGMVEELKDCSNLVEVLYLSAAKCIYYSGELAQAKHGWRLKVQTMYTSLEPPRMPVSTYLVTQASALASLMTSIPGFGTPKCSICLTVIRSPSTPLEMSASGTPEWSGLRPMPTPSEGYGPQSQTSPRSSEGSPDSSISQGLEYLLN